MPRGRAASVPYGADLALEELGEGMELCIVEGAADTLAMRVLRSKPVEGKDWCDVLEKTL